MNGRFGIIPWARRVSLMLALCCLVVVLSIPLTVPAADNADDWDYPLRPFYPVVKTIRTDRFLEIYDREGDSNVLTFCLDLERKV